MSKKIDFIAVKEVSKILGEHITGSELTKIFSRLHFYDHDALHPAQLISTKWKRIENTITFECRKKESAKPFFILIESILTPALLINSKYDWNTARMDTNKILLFYGYQLSDLGKIEHAIPASNINDAQQRFMSFEEKLSIYDIHPEIEIFCREELFYENYFHAIFEASKSVLARVRNISSLESDGVILIDNAFLLKRPIILIKNNMLNTQSEKSEYNGLKSLLNTIVYMYRNPQAHGPKLYNPKLETDAITAFTLMSLAHRILDNCINVRDL